MQEEFKKAGNLEGGHELFIAPSRKTGRRETKLTAGYRYIQRQGKPAACGHTVIHYQEPHSKCFDCWHSYFSQNPKLVYGAFDFLQAGKEAEIKAARGTKFLKMFKRFVSHVQSIAPIQAEDAVVVDGGEQ